MAGCHSYAHDDIQAKIEAVSNFSEQLAALEARQAKDEAARQDKIYALRALVLQKQVRD
jgi:hypothetical protein